MMQTSKDSTTENDVQDSTKQMEEAKAVGRRGIHPSIVKTLAETLTEHFTHLFNVRLEERQLPED